ncbi:MAG: MarR family winged helix-turn-helix transcriptional regulator [Candidatus Limnocylindrales bacterium]
MPLTISGEHSESSPASANAGAVPSPDTASTRDAVSTPDPAQAPTDAVRRRRLVEEFLEELNSTPRDRMDAYQRWHRGALSLVHLNVLSVLEAEGPTSMGRLAEALDVSVASATGIVRRMIERGVVERRHDAADRRVVLVHLTEAGSNMSAALGERRREHLVEILDLLTEPELNGLMTGLRALHRARSRFNAACGPAAPADPAAPAQHPGAAAQHRGDQ